MEKMTPLDVAVHDLCQPLTTMQCVLEMAAILDTPEAYREAVNVGIMECARLINRVNILREILRATA